MTTKEKEGINEFLDSIRKKNGYSKFQWSKDFEFFINKIPEKSRKLSRKIWHQRIGENMSKIHSDLISQYLNLLEPLLSDKQKKIIDETFFGIYPTGEFNAKAGKIENGQKLVLLHEGLVHSLAIFSHWYLKQFEDKSMKMDKENIEYFLQYFCCVWFGDIENYQGYPNIYPCKADSWMLSEALCLSAIIFVFGHEIGHLEYGHTGYTNEQQENHKKEFEADNVGLKLIIKFSLYYPYKIGENDTFITKFILFGPYIALATSSLLLNTSSSTHPSIITRVEKIAKSYDELMKIELKDNYKVMMKNLDEKIFDLLYSNIDNLLKVTAIYHDFIKELITRKKYTIDAEDITKYFIG